jgi:hypothetical protein
MNPSSSLPFPALARAAAEPQVDGEPPHGELVTVTRVFNCLEAEMLRGCLGAEGIPATLGDVQTVQTDTLLTVAMGGIRVMVPAPFAASARLTVEAFERGALEIDELPADAQAAAPDDDAGVATRPWLSRSAWIVLAIVIIAVAVF